MFRKMLIYRVMDKRERRERIKVSDSESGTGNIHTCKDDVRAISSFITTKTSSRVSLSILTNESLETFRPEHHESSCRGVHSYGIHVDIDKRQAQT